MTDNGSPTDANASSGSAEEFPSRLRVHALARTLGLTSRQVLAHLTELGVETRSPQSSIDREVAQRVADRVRAHVEVDEAAVEAVEDAADTAGTDESGQPEVEPVGPDTAETTPAETTPAATDAPAAESPAADIEAAADESEVSSTPTPETGGMPSLFSSVEQTQHQPISAAEVAVSQPLFLSPQAVEPVKRAQRQAKAVEKKQPEEKQPEDKKSQGAKPDSAKSDSAQSDGAKSDRASDDEAGAGKADDVDADKTRDDDNGRDDDSGGDGDRGSRRRRRGRRGRGRGRGDQADTGTDDTSDSTDEDSDDESADAAGDDRSARPSGKKSKKAKAKDKDRDSDDGESRDDEGEATDDAEDGSGSEDSDQNSSKRRRRRRRRKGGADDAEDASPDDPPNTVVHEREPRSKRARDEVQGISGSTRLEAKRQRRRDGRDAGRRRPPILSESEFLARREAVDRVMVVRERSANSSITVGANPGDHGHDQAVPVEDYTQVAVLEDGVLVEHFVTTETSSSMVGNIYLGRVQNVLPGMEAAFVDIGRGRNGVLYAGEVNWDAAGLDGGSRKIEQALKPGDNVLVQVSKDPVGHKGARLTTQISLAGRYLVYVPGGSSTGISRKLPDVERKRLKSILGKLVPDDAGVIIRTASEGVSAEDLGADIERLEGQWKEIDAAVGKAKGGSGSTSPQALYEEPDLLVRVVRDLFNEDFKKLVVEGQKAWDLVQRYIGAVAPDLMDRVERFERAHADAPDSFVVHRIDEQLAKALDRKVWLPSGGTLIIEHTEAMTVVDVNTGKFTGSGGNLEETVTRNNLEAAEEIVRQMRLRDIGGMIIVDFIDMVLESNRDLVLRRLTEALARDRTRHQVSEVTSLGLVQMTRKRLGTGLLEAFSTTCTHCSGRGIIVHANPVEVRSDDTARSDGGGGSKRSRRNRRKAEPTPETQKPAHNPAEHPMFRAMAAHTHDHDGEHESHEVHGESEVKADTAADQEDAAQGDHADVVEKTTKVSVEKPADGDSRDADSRDTSVSSEPRTAASESVAAPETTPSKHEDAATAASEAEPTPGSAPKRRRRVVRQAASPPTASEPVVLTADTDGSSSGPKTTFGPVGGTASSEAAVAVRRRPRRRTAGRPAGPPPAEE
ncbi:translation initiation factor IF-2 N-terminal domain-containing protein [Gordonia sp. SL306]|uniref:translation initiation factor IF-2 N-terminal domain-containing protein n=1 Tax=Gordonia sp. SL306 TaxID=2995145 RepID=UPI00226FFD32|nr:translation initiation factor IF-2 N-terminal domain-containing protein [Gordonia sp. SL306]WAC55058.1 translation initiation factor IF-2 N-terminal domain-containing protein [Gordonia sp. SL306]